MKQLFQLKIKFGSERCSVELSKLKAKCNSAILHSPSVYCHQKVIFFSETGKAEVPVEWGRGVTGGRDCCLHVYVNLPQTWAFGYSISKTQPMPWIWSFHFGHQPNHGNSELVTFYIHFAVVKMTAQIARQQRSGEV